MDFWTFLRVSSFLTYIGLAAFLIVRNPKSRVNRTAAVFIFCLSIWSFGDIFTYFSTIIPYFDKTLFVNIKATSWLCLPSVFLLFVLTFTNREGMLGLSRNISYIPLLCIPVMFVYKQYTNTLFPGGIDAAKTWSAYLWQYSFYIYYLSFMGQALYVMLDFMEKTADAASKKQAKIISSTTIITILSVSVFNIVIPEWRISVIVRETDLVMFSMLIWASGLVYAVSAYKSIGITPALILDKIISSMTDFLLVADREGNIVNANSAAIHLLGYKKKELENMSLAMLVRDAELKKNITEKILANDYMQDQEITLKRKDGKNVVVLFSGHPLLHDNKTVIGIACIAKDITRHKQIEEEMQESEARHQSIIAYIQDGLTIIENEKITYMNNRVREIFGYDQREPLDLMSIDLAAPEEKERIKPLFEKMHTAGAYPRELEYWAVTKNNDRRYIRNQFTLIKCGNASSTLLIITADITDQKKAEESLRASEGKLRTILMNTRDIIYTAHADRTITFISPQISCFGYEPAEFIGHNLTEFMHPDDSESVRNDYERTRQIGLDFPIVYRLMAKDGASVYFEEFSKSIKENGAVVQVIGSLRDISERKQMEKDKEDLTHQLYQVQKMDAMGTLAAGIAHDFNNSLSAIQGFASLILMEIDDHHPFYHELKEIHKATERAAHLANQLLVFSRQSLMEFKATNINQIIRDLTAMLKRIIVENITINVELEDNDWVIQADRCNIEQVITNLAINARDAMPNGGVLTIKTEKYDWEHNNDKTIQEIQPGKFVCFSVRDTGIGMTKEICQKIFDPFFTTKRGGKGTGLGLAVVYGIVKQHGGWIKVDSEPGKGTLIKVYFPAASICAEALSAETAPAAGYIKGNGEGILVVEDEEPVRRVVKLMLEKNGYRVFEASNSKDALDLFKLKKEQLDFVFSDNVLPDKSGIALVNEILCAKPSMHVVLCSGYVPDKNRINEIEEKGVRFIKKPYKMEDMLSLLKQFSAPHA